MTSCVPSDCQDSIERTTRIILREYGVAVSRVGCDVGGLMVRGALARRQANYKGGITTPPQKELEVEELVGALDDEESLEELWGRLQGEVAAQGGSGGMLTIRPADNCGQAGVAKLTCAEDLVRPRPLHLPPPPPSPPPPASMKPACPPDHVPVQPASSACSLESVQP